MEKTLDVDVLYVTSDGVGYVDEDVAKQAASKLVDKTVTPHYKDEAVREMGKAFTPLEKMIFATDYLKRAKAMHLSPSYPQYQMICDKASIEPVTEEAFNFINSKVTAKVRVSAMGQQDDIFTWKKGITKATFVKRFELGQMWMMDDVIVLTCPTNTELARISAYDLFKPLLGNKPHK